jgi:hypothetical protein
MTYEPIAADLAVRLTRQHVGSARPDAPVIPERSRPRRLRSLRATMAADLHRFASWVEPAESCRVATTRS